MEAHRAVERLMAGNARFADGNPDPHRADPALRTKLADGQTPFACIVTCSDSRVPPEILFDQSLGDLFVVRVAGTILTPEVIGSVEFAVEQLHVPLVVVMAHSRCGAVAAAIAETPLTGALAAVIDRLKPFVAPVKAAGLTGTALESEVSRRNTRNLIAALQTESPAIAAAVQTNTVELHRVYYDIATGRVDWDF
ncbi:MAG: carbonic anhydrase [Calditrichota bacterium]